MTFSLPSLIPPSLSQLQTTVFEIVYQPQFKSGGIVLLLKIYYWAPIIFKGKKKKIHVPDPGVKVGLAPESGASLNLSSQTQ